MAEYSFQFPDIGEGLEEGIIVDWHVRVGQEVSLGDTLVSMETDKVVADIPAPKKGRILALCGEKGETVRVGETLVKLEIESETESHNGPESESPHRPVSTESTASQSRTIPVSEAGGAVVGTLEDSGEGYLKAPSAAGPATGASSQGSSESGSEEEKERGSKASKGKATGKSLATPFVRAMARKFKLSLSDIQGSGAEGRILEEDILRHIQAAAGKQTGTPGKISPDQTPANRTPNKQTDKDHAAPPRPGALPENTSRHEYESLSQLRKTIAKNMMISMRNSAQMALFEEVEITELNRVRKHFKPHFQNKGVSLSYLPFIIKAVTMALQKYRIFNAVLDEEHRYILYKKYYNIGIAVDTAEGLVVPVIPNTDSLSLLEIARAVQEQARKARDRSLRLEDLKNGTFTITNYGALGGGLFAVPVINYPQAAILGIGRISPRPVIKEDAVVKGLILPLSLTIDHRIIDGGVAVPFINTIISALKDPLSMIE